MGTHPIFESDFDCLTEMSEESEKSENFTVDLRIDGDIEINKVIDCGEEVFSCQISPLKIFLAVTLNNGIVKIFRLADYAHVYSLYNDEVKKEHLPAVCCDWISDSRLLVGYASGSIRVWNISNNECLQSTKENRTILQACLTRDKKYFVTSGNDSNIYIYELEGLKKVHSCFPTPSYDVMDGHRTSVYCVKNYPMDEFSFISGGWDDTVQFWDRREPHAVRRIFGPHICGQAIDINQSGTTILTGSWRLENALELWDYRQGKLLKNFPEHDRTMYYSANFIGEECIAAGGSNQNALKFKDRISTADLSTVKNLNGGVFCFDHSKKRVKGEKLDVTCAFGFSQFISFGSSVIDDRVSASVDYASSLSSETLK